MDWVRTIKRCIITDGARRKRMNSVERLRNSQRRARYYREKLSILGADLNPFFFRNLTRQRHAVALNTNKIYDEKKLAANKSSSLKLHLLCELEQFIFHSDFCLAFSYLNASLHDRGFRFLFFLIYLFLLYSRFKTGQPLRVGIRPSVSPNQTCGLGSYFFKINFTDFMSFVSLTSLTWSGPEQIRALCLGIRPLLPQEKNVCAAVVVGQRRSCHTVGSLSRNLKSRRSARIHRAQDSVFPTDIMTELFLRARFNHVCQSIFYYTYIRVLRTWLKTVFVGQIQQGIQKKKHVSGVVCTLPFVWCINSVAAGESFILEVLVVHTAPIETVRGL